jgi:hypothetical protein
MTTKKIHIKDATNRASVEDQQDTRKEAQAEGKKKKKSKKTYKKPEETAVDDSSESRMKW